MKPIEAVALFALFFFGTLGLGAIYLIFGA